MHLLMDEVIQQDQDKPPKNIKAEYNSLDHNKLFGMDKETNITDPII